MSLRAVAVGAIDNQLGNLVTDLGAGVDVTAKVDAGPDTRVTGIGGCGENLSAIAREKVG